MEFVKLAAAASVLVAIICWSGLSEVVTASDSSRQPEEQNLLGPEWELVAQSDDITSFINLKTIRASGPIVKAWGIHNSEGTARGRAYKSSKWMDEYDCIREELRTVTVIAHSEQYGLGSIIDSSAQPGNWRPIAPGSFGERLWNFACRLRDVHTVNPGKWLRITGNDETVYYASTPIRQRSGNLVKMLVLTDYIEPFIHDNGVVAKSEKHLKEFDCTSRTSRSTSHYAEYSEDMGRGAIVFVGTFSEANNSQWREVKKGTYWEDVWKFACNQK